jgi:hypothetical protein
MQKWQIILAGVFSMGIMGQYPLYTFLQHGRVLLSPAIAIKGRKSDISPDWVFLALYSGDDEIARRAEATWFRGDVGRVAFGFYKSVDVPCKSRWVQASTFENTRRAFLQAKRCYPTGKYFARFNVDSNVDRAQLMARVGTADYFGSPVKSGNSVFASGTLADGYVLSLKAVRQLQSCNVSESNEDAGIGECLRVAGIELAVG